MLRRGDSIGPKKSRGAFPPLMSPAKHQYLSQLHVREVGVGDDIIFRSDDCMIVAPASCFGRDTDTRERSIEHDLLVYSGA